MKDLSHRGVLPSVNASALSPAKATGDQAQMTAFLSGSAAVILGLIDWDVKWKRKAIASTTTDNAGYAGNIASTADWSATAKFAHVDGDVSQEQLRAAMTTLQTTSQPYTFINAAAGDVWAGNGFLTGIDETTGLGKLFGMDITIEGDGALQNTGGVSPGLLFQDTVTGSFVLISVASGAVTLSTASGGVPSAATLIDTATGTHYSLTLSANEILPVAVSSSTTGVPFILLADTVTGAHYSITVTNAAFFITQVS